MRPTKIGEVIVCPLGGRGIAYAQVAIESFPVFESLRAQISISAGTRFQVSLPSPFAPMMTFMAAGSFEPVELLYVAAMRREVNDILSAIPHVCAVVTKQASGASALC
jgi:hypothetical protein